MVEFFIATAQALSLAALLYGAYFVLLRGPQLARTPASVERVAKNEAREARESAGEREGG
jgi:hypothetical protein